MGIIAGGRLIVRPAYAFIANIRNSDVFAATTLLIVLGTSVLTQLAGLSLALGAFLVSSSLSCRGGVSPDRRKATAGMDGEGGQRLCSGHRYQPGWLDRCD